MPHKESLFERIFKQPASAAVLPEENLATEVMAYFLDHCIQFRERFLQEIAIEDCDGGWVVKTQKVLHGVNRKWHLKRPDITLSKDGNDRVIVEVKIEAACDPAQTEAYGEYLKFQQNTHGLKTCLAALTRWEPDPRFRNYCHSALRFKDIAKWLEEAGGAFGGGLPGSSPLDWVAFLTSKRWTMIEITQEQVDAIRISREAEKNLKELGALLDDSVRKACREAEESHQWVWLSGRGRCASLSASESPGSLREGSVRLMAPLGLAGCAPDQTESPCVQVGAFYGTGHASEPAICGVLFLRGKYVDWFCDRWAGELLEPHGILEGEYLFLDNLLVVTNPEFTNGNELLDKLHQQLKGALGKLSQLRR